MTEKLDKSMETAILREAERLFLEKGFALTSTTEIARAVGCNQALIHYYFRTKENLFAAIFEGKMRELVTGFFTVDASIEDFKTLIKSIVEAHFDLIRKNPQLPFLIYNEIITNPSRIEMIRERLGDLPESAVAIIEPRLRAEIAAGRIRPISPIDLAIDVVSVNVMFFVAAPVFRQAFRLGDEDYERLVEARRRESVELIMRRLEP